MYKKNSFFSLLFSEKLRIALYKLSKNLKKQFRELDYEFDIIDFYNLFIIWIYIISIYGYKV